MTSLAFPSVPRPRVSILMVTYGGWEWVHRALEAILAHTESCYELIVVDNASPDGLGELLGRKLTNVRVVRNAVNRGFGCANNQAAGFAIGEILALVNSDAFVRPGWLVPLLERLDSDPSAAAVAPKLLNEDGSLQEAGSVLFENGYTQFVGFGDDPERGEHRFARVVDYASAACLLVRRRDFFEVGGFDAAYAPGFFEDVDLCLALKARGRRVLYEPRSTVTHLRGASWGKEGGIAHWTANAPVFAQRWGRLLSTRPGFAPASGSRKIAARDAPATVRILVAADRLDEPPDPVRTCRSSWLSTELALLYPDARITLLGRSASKGSVAEEGLLARGVEVALSDDWQAFLHARRFHYDVLVLAGAAAIDQMELLVETQPQAFLVVDASAFSEGIPRRGRSLRRREMSRGRELEALTAADVALFSSLSDVSWARSVRRPESCFLLPVPLEVTTAPPGFWPRANFLFLASEEPAGPADESALAYLVERVLPLVRRDDPRVEILVAATLSAELRLRLEREDVQVLAPDLAALDHFDRARLLVAPFPRRPASSDFLLRAAVLGLPFVATRGAAAGLPFDDVPESAVAGTARELAGKLHALNHDEILWKRVQRTLLRKSKRSLERELFRETLIRAFARVGLAPPAHASSSSFGRTALSSR